MGSFFVVGPFWLEGLFEPLGDFRFGLVLVGLLVGLTAAISSGLFKVRGRTKDRLLRGEGLLAHWTYSPEEWHRFAEEDADRANRIKWGWWLVIAFWAVLFGIVFPWFDPEDGWAVTWTMAGLLVLLAGVIVVGTKLRRSRRHRSRGEVRIAPDGLWLGGNELHVWRGWGSCLESVEVVRGDPPCLEIEYSIRARHGRQSQKVRVPIPQDRDAEAAEVAARLLASIESGP